MSVLKTKDGGGNWTSVPSIKGDTGDAAGFGTVVASVDASHGTPSVTVTTSGDDTAKNFDFAFHNLQPAPYDDSELQQDFATLQGQFDTAVSAVTTDTEVTDIRVGADGITDTTAGASVRRQFTDLKSDLNLIPITMTEGAYYNLSGSSVTIGSPTTYVGKKYALVPCAYGDVFTISGVGGNAARPWAFVTSSGSIIETNITNGGDVTLNGDVRVAPANAAYLILNNNTDNTLISYYGKYTYSEIKELEDAFKHFSDSLYNTISLIRNESGETIIADFPVVAGHTYKIYVKTSINIGASALIGLGSNGNTSISASDLYNGYTWTKTATTSASSSRVYIIQTSGSYSGKIFAYIKDLGVVESEDADLGYLSEPDTYKWYDGAINASTGAIDSLGSYLHSNLIKIDCSAEAVFNAVGLRYYSADGSYLNAYKSGATNQLLDNGTYKYVKFVISGQDPSNFRVYSSDDITPFDGYENAVAVMRNGYVGTISADNNMHQFFTVAHITDMHGDRVRFGRIVDFAEKIGVDAIINTGDSVRYYGTDDFSFVTDKIAAIDTPYFQTLGNHELQSMTSESSVYNKFISPFVADNGYVLGGTGKPYYHADISSKNIRLIVVDQYEKYNGSMDIQLSEAQLNWFCQTLASTPANYGVIVCNHIPEVGISKDNDHAMFYQEPYWNESTTACFSKIVDAFISGTSFSDTLHGYSITADFTTKASGAHFVAFINGHQHQDRIGVVQGTTNRQLVLNSICSNAWLNMNQNGTLGTSYPYFNELNDIGRIDKTPTQDAFNIYAFDFANKTVRVARIGSSITTKMDERKRMIIPYA